jgi:hypothetical protein
MKFCCRTAFSLFAFFLSAIFSYGAQENSIQIAAELGFGNLFHPESPLPIQIDVSSTQSVEGRMEIVTQEKTIYETPISLSLGARKRWRLTLPSITDNSVIVKIIDTRGKILSEQQIFGIKIQNATSLLVVVQEDTGQRFSFPKEEISNQWQTAGIASESLPENPIAYMGVTAILWRSDKAQALTPAQLQALVLWVKNGGRLIIAGGRTVAPEISSLVQLGSQWSETIPFQIKNFAEVTLAPLLSEKTKPVLTQQGRSQTWDWVTPATGLISEEAKLSGATIAIRPLLGEETRTRMEHEGLKLFTEQACGRGWLSQLAFDPMDLLSEKLPLEIPFWAQALYTGQINSDPVLENISWLIEIANDPNHIDLATAANYRIAPISQIIWLFGTFISIAFGLNFWLFRKSRRYEWAWLILIISSLGLFIYNCTFGRVGKTGPMQQIELSQSIGTVGEKSLISFSQIGLLAPHSRKENFATLLPHQIFLGLDRETRKISLSASEQKLPVRTHAGAFTTCSSISYDELPGDGISVTINKVGDSIEMILENKTGLELVDPQVSTSCRPPQSIDPSFAYYRGGMNSSPRMTPQGWSTQYQTEERAENIPLRLNGKKYSCHLPPKKDGQVPARLYFRFALNQNSPISTKSGASTFISKRNVTLALPFYGSDKTFEPLMVQNPVELSNNASTASTSNKINILKNLPTRKNLIETVVQENWLEDARPILTGQLKKELEKKDPKLPQAWIHAVASFQDPMTYEDLKSYFLKGADPQTTYRDISQLPGIDLTEIVAQAWKEAQADPNPYRIVEIQPIAAQCGHVNALVGIAQQLQSGNLHEKDKASLLKIIKKYIDPQKTDQEIIQWILTNETHLAFDSQTKKYKLNP